MILWLLISLLAPVQPVRNLELSFTPAEPLQGQLVLIEVRGLQPEDRVDGTFGRQKLRFFIDGKERVRSLGAVLVSQRPGRLPLQVKVRPRGGSTIIKAVPVPIRAATFPETQLKVDPKFVKPPKKYWERIQREVASISRLWRVEPTVRQWQGNFTNPRAGVLCSPFGQRRTLNGQTKSRHFGIDLDGAMGDPILAMAGGTVVMVEDRYYSGGTVVIDHGLKLFSMYFHMSEYAIKVGDRVTRGQLIGKVGNSGIVTGPHLHLSTKVEGINFDPLSLLELDFDEETPPPAPAQEVPATPEPAR